MTEPVIKGPGLYRCANGSKTRIVHVEAGYAFGFTVHDDGRVWFSKNGERIARSFKHHDITGPWHEPVEGWVVVAPCHTTSIHKIRENAAQLMDSLSKDQRLIYVREVPPPHDEPAK